MKLVLYAGTALVSLIAYILAFHVWRADLHVPFSYFWYGDSIEPQLKQLLDGGWFFEPHLAAPFGQHSVAIAQVNSLKWFIRWILAEITQSPFMAQNLFVMLTPVLASLTFLYAARRLGLAFSAAVPCAILYGNLYMLYWRVLAAHSMQAAYWMTPLGCLAALQIAHGMRLTQEGKRFTLTRDGAVFIGTAFLIGMESHYECFFAGALVLAALIVGSIQLRNFQPLKAARAFLVVMVLSFVVNISPTAIFLATHHGATYSYARNPVEAYLYSLSIGQMILPNPDHRIGVLARARDHFDDVFPALSNENKSATLGFAGTIGLCILLGCLIARGTWKVPRTLEHAALLTLAAIVLATTGSIGAVFNRFVTPDIRAYNRISTWISFFCLLAVVFALERLWLYLRDRGHSRVYLGVAAVIAVLGVLDQSPLHRPPYEDSHRQELVDKAWVDQIGGSIIPTGAVLQLPYADDLESRLGLLQQLPFMLSPGLHWSVGAFRGTPEANFENWLGSLPPKPMVAAALLAGFDGILVYRDEYNDKGAALEAGLRTTTGRRPLVGEDQSQSFFPIDGLAAAARATDPAVGTPQGIAEAVDISRNANPQQAEQLVRIENAIGGTH